MQNEMNYEHIPQEEFAFAQTDIKLHDKKLETKAKSFWADALSRFRKNKSSVIAAYIIAFLILFAIFAPILSPYTIKDTERVYTSYPPYVESVAKLNIGILDGAITRPSQSDTQLEKWHAIGQETGMDPVLRILGTTETRVKWKNDWRVTTYYKIENNRYFETGILYRTLSYEEFDDICRWQDKTGLQVIYPYVESKDILNIKDQPNIWYQVSDERGTPVKDENGNLIPAYSTNKEVEGRPYNSIRIAGDDGSYIYSLRKSGAVNCRICYYNYYKYLNGHAPQYLMGTNSMGFDLFMAIGTGARFSLIFAVIVSAINLSIGAVYGAIQGYYGGAIDLLMDRIADILYDVPFIVVATLFQLHLAQKVGVVVSFLFAFVLTGWIGMAALTRKQFYRFKGQEFVLAARTLGASDWRLMFKHIFPNSLGTIVTSCALVIPSVVGSETQLTYLGIINLSEFAGTTLGTLMSQGQNAMTAAPHAMLYPALYFSLLMVSFNLFGNGLRDAFNPSTRGVED